MIFGYAGQALLGIALVLAGFQAFGPARLDAPHRLAYGQALFLFSAFMLLTYAHVTDQFSLLSVVQHSHTAKPLLYKISGVWGNHEGSMLLMVLILVVYGAVVARQVKGIDAPYSLAIPLMGLMNFGFLLFVVMACDPFAIADPIPLEGQDLNPLLQDPSLAIHPPILYAGYAGFSVPFIFSVATLIHGKMPETFASLMRPWVLVAWTFLTLGVGLGSYWAYYELGWGGWWFWDPVENAALMPFLTATALVHAVCTLAVTKSLRLWTLFLSILTFALCLFGTFLVRSGLLTSVHNFAVDPERGAFILILSSFLMLPALGLFLWRLKEMRSPIPTTPASRQGLILMMTLILVTGTATIALGTLYPLILETFGLKITVGAPYFNATFVPMMLPLLVLLGLGLWYSWAGQGLSPSSSKWLLPIVCLTFLSVLVAYYGFGVCHVLGLAAFMGAVWSILATVAYAIKKKKILSGTIFAHLGMGVAILGMVGSSLGEKELITVVKVGDKVAVGPVSLTLLNVIDKDGPNYKAQRAILKINPDGPLLTPEKRLYWTQGVIHGESAIRSVGFGRLHHIYVTLGEAYEGKKWSIHAYYKPFINLLWIGILLMVFGGILASRKRFRTLKRVFPMMMILLQPTICIDAHEQLANPDLEERARALSQVILCPTCQGQLVDGSPVEAAIQVRRDIRDALKQGQSDDQIMKSLSAQYGPQVIITPRKDWSTSVLWFGPWAIFLLIFGLFLHKNRQKTQKGD
ncbi:MAG: cytochrome c biogenesis protein CcsA [Alphaproteobacteria bacterium]|jgi:cytochrome c-type biogenesis protein CcmF|nr:cytochrome c biogenesis protein CcsA [Alphaproteobacteria bacterium]